jgi:hypothetical protein
MKNKFLVIVFLFFSCSTFAQNWSLTGNSGTSGSNFLGTTDSQPLIFKVKDTLSGIIATGVSSNTAFGFNTLKNTGTWNTAFGYNTMASNTTGFYNTAIGANSLLINNTGTGNTAMGAFSLRNNTSGSWNLAMGGQSLYANTTGTYNTSLGHEALKNNTTGSYNTGVGNRALYNNIAANSNTAIGDSALYYTNYGENNVAIGHNAGLGMVSGNNNIFIGKNTYYNAGANYQLVIGSDVDPWIAGDNGDIHIFRSLTTNGNIAVRSTIPSNHDQDSPGIWLSNTAALLADNTPEYSSVVMAQNVRRNATTHFYDSIDSSKPAWMMALGNGEYSDGFAIMRSAPGTFNPEYFFTINPLGNIGVGTNIPNAKLDVNGTVLSGGSSASLDPATFNMSFIENTGKMLMGWNKSASEGESDFVANQGTGSNGGFAFYNHDNSGTDTLLFRIKGDGNIGIGTRSPDAKLAVNGIIHAKEIKVNLTNWPDYVFNSNYKLPKLSDIKNYIRLNQHLPGVPSEQDVAKNGIQLGEMNKLLVKKIEELTLYVITKDKEVA